MGWKRELVVAITLVMLMPQPGPSALRTSSWPW